MTFLKYQMYSVQLVITTLLLKSASSFLSPSFCTYSIAPWTKNDKHTKIIVESSKQALYGETEAIPNSYVRCGKCLTSYAITEADLDLGDRSGGRRLECSICGHSWFQTKDRLMTVQEDFVLAPLPQRDVIRIQRNIEEGKSPKFMGDKKLYVGNISFECREDDLYSLFSSCGEVGDVSFVRDDAGRSRGFGFVTMRTEDAGLKAVAELDGMAVRGRNIAVRESTN